MSHGFSGAAEVLIRNALQFMLRRVVDVRSCISYRVDVSAVSVKLRIQAFINSITARFPQMVHNNLIKRLPSLRRDMMPYSGGSQTPSNRHQRPKHSPPTPPFTSPSSRYKKKEHAGSKNQHFNSISLVAAAECSLLL